jgi:hypothetical protein
MKHIVFRIVAGLVLIAAITGIAFFAFNAGMAQGAALNIQAPAVQNGVQPYPYYGMHFGHPFMFGGLGCFAPLLGLFLVFLAFGAMRRMMFGPRFGWHGMHHGHGPWGDKSAWEDGVPPMMAEMHRRMHAAENEKPTDESAQK